MTPEQYSKLMVNTMKDNEAQVREDIIRYIMAHNPFNPCTPKPPIKKENESVWEHNIAVDLFVKEQTKHVSFDENGFPLKNQL